MATSDDNTTTSGTTDTTSGGQPNAGVSVNASLPAVSQVVDPKRLLWLGGLAALGAVGVLEWPVVAAVGVGSYVAEQFAKSDVQRSRQQ